MYRLIQVSLIITACLSSFFADAQSCKHAHKYYGQVKSASTLPSSLFRASNTRSDSVDVLRYQINLDITDFTNREIAGNCEILIRSKIDGLSNLLLDLQGFIIDSVTVGSIPLSYTYNSILLDITLPLVLNDFEEESITVYYHGQPAQDPSWGGFYWAGDYAFNMGVAFDYAPHNFGRAWFPCFDNFVERSLFVFRITTSDNKKAYCNGLLESELDNGDGTITYEWRMQDEIPTYLASVAVAPYTEISYTYEGIIDDIPVILAAVPGDTSNARTHFQNLDFCIEQFEDKYGPHRFDRIGFAMVPFSGGAMEHATSIHYPRFAITGGSLDFETLYAHELAHHWWGDNITCRTPEDMWLNEGWASWSERLFLEKVYGRAAYEASIRENHMDVIRYSHRRDGGVRRAVSGVPHEYTYGSNVYDRGADVVHTLRGYMGDEDFFGCITSFQSTYQHSDVSSLDLQNHLTDCSGKDMSHFFNDWIFTPGWTGYSVDSFYTEEMEAGQFFVRAYLRQRLGEEGVYHTEVPLPLRFIAEDGAIQEETAMLSGVCGYYDIVLPFAPKFIGVDHKELLSDAAIGETIVFASPAVYESEQALMDIEVIDVGGDSAWLRLEHHFTRADGFINPRPGLHISKERYWKISGMVGEDFLATAELPYSALPTTSGGYLDNGLITNSEDSLVLLYRSKPGLPWEEYEDYFLEIQFSAVDKRGRMELSKLALGEYALAIYDATIEDEVWLNPSSCAKLNTGLDYSSKLDWSLHPNPASTIAIIELGAIKGIDRIEISTLSGAVIHQIDNPSATEIVNIGDWTSGLYIVKLYSEGKAVLHQSVNKTQKLMVIR